MTLGPNAAAFDPETDDVFGRIAGRCDKLCDVFSLLQHRFWKARMAARIAREAGGTILDVASGTGDIPERLLKRLDANAKGASTRLIVSDISAPMLAIAAPKLEGSPLPVDIRLLDAHRLDVPADSIDAYSISFGMKICDRARVTAEALRVLKPGGLFYCLEAARIPIELIHNTYLAYMGWCLPLIANLATDGDRSAYDYLLRGVREFPAPAAFGAELSAAGFADVGWETMSFGIVALHAARKPPGG
jgi:ubiquinone/menaquinone biosynthesis methyltransferase